MARSKAAPAAGATTAPLTPREAKATAIQRCQSRRRPPRYGEIPDGRGGVFRWELDTGGGPIADPEDLGQWLDDRIARCALGAGACDVLIETFERMRGGVAAVPDAIAYAAGMLKDPHQQWGAYMVLSSLPGGPPGIESLRAQVTREWRKRGLQDRPPPAAPFGRDPLDRDSIRPRNIEYRSEWGHPAGMTL